MYKGPVDVVRRVWAREGVRGLLAGFNVTLTTRVFGMPLYLTTFDLTREALSVCIICVHVYICIYICVDVCLCVCRCVILRFSLSLSVSPSPSLSLVLPLCLSLSLSLSRSPSPSLTVLSRVFCLRLCLHRFLSLSHTHHTLILFIPSSLYQPPPCPDGEKPKIPISSVAVCGAAAGAGFWTVMFPLDAVKTRVQTAGAAAAAATPPGRTFFFVVFLFAVCAVHVCMCIYVWCVLFLSLSFFISMHLTAVLFSSYRGCTESAINGLCSPPDVSRGRRCACVLQWIPSGHDSGRVC
jgi:hypothetical protein